MDTTMYVAMGSILVGFLLFGGAYTSFYYGKSRKLVWTLFALAIVFMTLIPVSLAIFVAA